MAFKNKHLRHACESENVIGILNSTIASISANQYITMELLVNNLYCAKNSILNAELRNKVMH